MRSGKSMVWLKSALLAACVLGWGLLHATPVLRLAVTTSVDNSGLTAHLLPAFEADTGVHVRLLAVGTGRALALGRAGDVDVLMVHSEADERAFVAAGYGLARHLVMRNQFLLLGPEEDPAQVASANSAQQAFERLAARSALFVSRGDDSGTHKRERSLWQRAGVESQALAGMRAVGQGMGRTLLISDQLGGYTLSDRGTWLAYRDKLALRPLLQDDPALDNPYGIIAVNPAKHPHVNHADAERFIQWITGERGQALIGDFTQAGQRLFDPAARAP